MDSVNWEWIVRCIEKENRDVIIVSRDADYGLTLEGKGYANDWLSEEVKERVNKQRKLILVDRLSAALKLFDVNVTLQEISSERLIIRRASAKRADEIQDLVNGRMHELLDSEEISSLVANTNTFGWSCDEVELGKIKFQEGVWKVGVSFSFSGEQDDDKPWHGNVISGSCVAEIDADKSVTFTDIEANLKDA